MVPTQPSRDSVPYCRVGITRSGRSNAPVMISILEPPIRRKLKGVPQAAQKSRIAIDEERYAAGFPRVQAKCSFGMSANEANGAPLAFWHIRQWQMLTFDGTADSAKRTAPHWQPPVRTGLFAVMLGPSVYRPLATPPAHRCRRKRIRQRRPPAARLPV